MTAKIRLWLQSDGGIDDDSKTVGSVTWCSWNANNTDTEYVRADLCNPTDERVKELEAENSRLRGALLVIEWNATQNAPIDSGRIARAALRYMGWSDD